MAMLPAQTLVRREQITQPIVKSPPLVFRQDEPGRIHGPGKRHDVDICKGFHKKCRIATVQR